LIPTVSMESQHSVDGPTSRDFSLIYIVRELSPDEVGSRSGGSGFLEKTTHCGKTLKISFRKDSPPRRSTYCANFVIFGWPEIGKVVRYLPDKEKQKTASSSALASARIAPKICHSQLQTIHSKFPKFHPNQFTSGGVIAERVNIV